MLLKENPELYQAVLEDPYSEKGGWIESNKDNEWR